MDITYAKDFKTVRKYGWRPSHPRVEKVKFGLSFKPTASKIDLRSLMSPIEDQGQHGTCVAHATCGPLEYLELLELKMTHSGKEVFPDLKFDPMSRLFCYYNSTAIDGNAGEDNGTSFSSMIEGIQTEGVCRESLWAYTDENLPKKPTHDCYKEAVSHTILQDYQLDHTNVNQLKACLSLGYPFVGGLSIYESFESRAVMESGVVPYPSAYDNFLGGHGLCFVGYEDGSDVFIGRNSWGKGWGMQGYFTIPYKYLTNWNLAADFWMLKKE
jgi:C1A family cysteine protease